ncbi:hypothetical protein P171DRAFT_429876 [Karstenula rhodostoma CBS 690.94]|uniref:Uncharacterized protein n=1 Tax=Karstenula rhodostoma CBS 690.94 TaxID=1392251 RepID=A0A9P4PPL4_9PLEO|nr:hypothetical protein P171DRAFT_429876 [Karstenula rhodostoma CBS 690.94]
MKAIIGLFTRLQPTTFRISYSPEYKTFLQHHAASDRLHPLYILRRREMAARKKEGLWWHVTSGIDLSRSGVVRTWCRRRLRNAFTEGLKGRGFDEFGRLVNVAMLRQHKGFERLSERDGGLSLEGSVQLRITPALVTTKYAEVRKETDATIDILLEGLKADSYWSHLSDPQLQSRALSQSKAPSRPRETASQVLPNTHSQQGQLSRFVLPSHAKAPSPKIRFQPTPSTPDSQKTFARRKTRQPRGNAKPRWQGWDS